MRQVNPLFVYVLSLSCACSKGIGRSVRRSRILEGRESDDKFIIDMIEGEVKRSARTPAMRALLHSYRDAVPGRRYPAIRDDFERIARRASAELVASGLRAALCAKDTPSVPDLVTKLFRSAAEPMRTEILQRLAKHAGEDAETVVAGIAAARKAQQVVRVGQLVRRAVRRSGAAARDELCDSLARHPRLATDLDGIVLTRALVAMAQSVRPVARKPRAG